jgi:hypothetical protein
VLTLLKEGVERPSWDDWFATLDTCEPVRAITHEDVIEALDEARNERDEQLERAFFDRHGPEDSPHQAGRHLANAHGDLVAA